MDNALGLTEEPDIAMEDDSASQSEGSQSSSELDGATPAPRLEGAYDPAEYTSLNVSEDIKDLFQHITR